MKRLRVFLLITRNYESFMMSAKLWRLFGTLKTLKGHHKVFNGTSIWHTQQWRYVKPMTLYDDKRESRKKTSRTKEIMPLGNWTQGQKSTPTNRIKMSMIYKMKYWWEARNIWSRPHKMSHFGVARFCAGSQSSCCAQYVTLLGANVFPK